ncbi:MAG: DNA polymerase III subunit gamma/tau [Polyangiaceae bacterium]
MSYLVLARKYRPQSFDDLVGQEHVARTLANAIGSGRVAHAFLFTGVRGVGKTTSARLLAKCLNCVGPDGKGTGPTAKPCQECAPCKEIAAGVDIDVQEIDGASYNGVDEVRKLQEGVNFRPARDRSKIYIVDEVHMLSNAAWNAFLKTLEEPPPHVKFIFATTEVHKVPVTILSRCQRYDFKLIPTQTVGKRLRQVLDAETIQAEDAAVSILAREAAGSMRDAMSLLDQVIAFSGQSLTEADVSRVLGVADRSILHELATALVTGDATTCLKVVDKLATQGFDLAHVSKDVLRHLRNVLVAKVAGTESRELLDLADEEVKDVEALAGKADADDLSRLFQGFSRAFDDVVRSGQPRAALEVALVRLARRPALLPLDELLVRVAELEKRLATGGAPPPRGGAGPKTTGAGATSISQAPGATLHAVKMPSTVPSWDASEASRTHGSLALADRSAPPVRRAVPLHQESRDVVEFKVPDFVRDMDPAPVEPSPRPSEPNDAPKPPPVDLAPVDLVVPPADELEAWQTIVIGVRAVHPAHAAVYEHGVPVTVTKARVVIGYPPESLLGTQASDAEALDALTRVVRAHFDASTEVALDLSVPRDASRATLAALHENERRRRTMAARAVVTGHPLVRKFVETFGAELREVRLPKSE